MQKLPYERPALTKIALQVRAQILGGCWTSQNQLITSPVCGPTTNCIQSGGGGSGLLP